MGAGGDGTAGGGTPAVPGTQPLNFSTVDLVNSPYLQQALNPTTGETIFLPASGPGPGTVPNSAAAVSAAISAAAAAVGAENPDLPPVVATSQVRMNRRSL